MVLFSAFDVSGNSSSMGILDENLKKKAFFKKVFLNLYIWGHVVKSSVDACFINQMVMSYLHFPYKTICDWTGEMLSLPTVGSLAAGGVALLLLVSSLIRAEYVTLVLFNLVLIKGLQNCSSLFLYQLAGTLVFAAFEQNWNFLPCFPLILNLQSTSSIFIPRVLHLAFSTTK